MSSVYIGQPNYNGTMHDGCAQGVYMTGTKRTRHIHANSMSLVSHNCNFILANALNLRESHDVEWLALLHSDLSPSPWWIDTLIDIAEKNDASLVAACNYIKDSRGLYSMAISDPNFAWTPFTRLTGRQVQHKDFPDTFDIEQAATALESLPGSLRVESVPRSTLQVNTGCCVIRLDDRAEGYFFDQLDTIYQLDGKFIAKTLSEDWRFSDRVASLGGKVLGTKLVKTTHYGNMEFPSDVLFGQDRDDECLST